MIHKTLCNACALLSISIGALLFVACDKDEVLETPPSKQTPPSTEVPPAEKDDSLKVTMKADFSRGLGKNFDNIQVKQWLYYDVSVTAPSKSGSLSYYLQLPNDLSGPYHRWYGQDYVAYFLPKETLTVLERNRRMDVVVSDFKLEEPVCKFAGAGDYCLIVQPLTAGTFQHNYKFIVKDSVRQKEQTVTIPNNFNCFKVECWINDVSPKKHRHRADFYFKIDDGNHDFDNFLAPREGRTMTYEVKYAGQTYNGDREGKEGIFVGGKDVLFHRGNVVRRYRIDNWNIDDIMVTIKEPGMFDVRVHFQNVPLIDRR